MEEDTGKDACTVFRDFSYLDERYRKSNYGTIEITLLENNKLKVYIFGIRETVGETMTPQSYMIIDFPDTIPIYDVINIILDKITEDHEYYLRDLKYRDFILCSEWLQDNFPEVCNFDRRQNITGGVWMEFTRETCDRYITPDYDFVPISEIFGNEFNPFVIKGSIDASNIFTYDYPIVGIHVEEEFYRITRGHHWEAIGRYKTPNVVDGKRYYILEPPPCLDPPLGIPYIPTERRHIQYGCAVRVYDTRSFKYEYTSVELHMLTQNRIYCCITNKKLSINECKHIHKDDGIVTCIVSFQSGRSLYDNLLDTFEKLDHKKDNYKDMILCPDHCEESHNQLNEHFGCKWVDFNRENIKYLDYADDIVDWLKVKYIEFDDISSMLQYVV